jgi:hypothetical protein
VEVRRVSLTPSGKRDDFGAFYRGAGTAGATVAVEGVSTRTTVRSQTSTTVRGAGTTRESVGAGTSVRERSSGGGNAGARSGGQGGQETTTGRFGGGGPAQKSGTGIGDAAGSR